MAYGATIVPRLNLILSIICKQYEAKRMSQDPGFHLLPVIHGAENPQCKIPEVQSLVSKFMLYLQLFSGLLSAIVSPSLGVLSDRYGRKIVIAGSTIGLVIFETITILVARNPETFSVYWMLLGAAADGLGGSFTTAMALSIAYASDCVGPQQTQCRIRLLPGLSICWNRRRSFARSSNHQIHRRGIICLLPRSWRSHHFHPLARLRRARIPHQRTPATRQRNRPKASRRRRLINKPPLVTASSASSASATPSAPSRSSGRPPPPPPRTSAKTLFALAAVDAIMFGVAMGGTIVVLLYAEYTFSWGTYETSVYVSIVNIGRVTTLFLLLPLLSRLLRGPASKERNRHSGSDKIDLGIIRAAILFDLAGYVGYSTVRSGPLFILFGVIGSIGGMGSPTLSSSLTKHVPEGNTGQLLGALGLLHACGRVIAPTIFNLIYAKTVGTFPQTVLVCLGGFYAVAFGFSLAH